MIKNLIILIIVILAVTACGASNTTPPLDLGATQTSITQARVLPSVIPTYLPILLLLASLQQLSLRRPVYQLPQLIHA
jgi:hypothetical protein